MPTEKLTIARRLLENVKVDRIEVASARVERRRARARVRRIVEWADDAGHDGPRRGARLRRPESVDRLGASRSGARVINLLTKGSLRHCREQLRRTPQQHLDDIRRTVEYGVKRGITLQRVSRRLVGRHDRLARLRHGAHRRRSTGMPVAAHHDLRHARHSLRPRRSASSWARMVVGVSGSRISITTATTTTAWARPTRSKRALAGARGVHVTVNGMGERAGNATLDEVVVALRDHARRRRRGVDERALADISQPRRGLLRPPHRRQQADRRRERVHADRRHPRRRRHEGTAVRKPPEPGAVRPASHATRWAS